MDESIDSLSASNFITELQLNGFVIIREAIPKKYHNILKKNYSKEFIEFAANENLDNIHGSYLGNLHINECDIHKKVWSLVNKNKTVMNTFSKLEIPSISSLNCGGNINLSNSTPQRFHRDSPLEKRNIIINIAISDIDLVNGPIEIISDSDLDGEEVIYMLKAKLSGKSKLLKMAAGDLLIRYPTTWHRGTSNKTNVARPILSYCYEYKLTKDSKENKSRFLNKVLFSGNGYTPGFLRGLGPFLRVFEKYAPRIHHLLFYLSHLNVDNTLSIFPRKGQKNPNIK